jgi:hypothetical protein
MWSAVGVVFDCASKRSMTKRMHGRDIDGERRRGDDSEISRVSIAHLEGVIFEVEGGVTLMQEGSTGRNQQVMVLAAHTSRSLRSIPIQLPPRRAAAA